MKYLAYASISIFLTLTAFAADLKVPVTLAEPAGVARKTEPATGGVPFKKGQVKSVDKLALLDKDGKPVPAQFSKLAPYEDGSVQWALVDFVTDLPAKAKSQYSVQLGKTAAPAKALNIEESRKQIVVDTGVAKFTINKRSFNLLEAVEIGDKKIAGPGSVDIVDKEGNAFAAGKPTKVLWEYKGPIRATLRVQGPYLSGDKTFASWTTRLTFWAGLSAVRVDHSVRNSIVEEGRDAYMQQATLSLDLAIKGADHGRGKDWAATGDGKNGVLVTQRHTGGAFPGGARGPHKVNIADGKATVWAVPKAKPGRGMTGYGKGYFVLADCAHKDTEIWLDFYTGSRDAKANSTRRNGLRSKLHLLPDGAWVSETGCMGYGHFGTLQDEIDTYKKWGWKGWDDPKKRRAVLRKHDPNANVDKEDVHFESESDSAELGLLMYLRTGERGWFDLGEAYARYWKTHATYRTDDFVNNGFKMVKDIVNPKATRRRRGLGFSWYRPKEYNFKDSRMGICHTWGTGLFDYYCLTGDVDALEGGLDIAEIAAWCFAKAKPTDPLPYARTWGRQFQALLRAWQVTRDKKWKEQIDRYGQWAIKASNRKTVGAYASTRGIAAMLKKKFNGGFPGDVEDMMDEAGLSYKIWEGEVIVTDKKGKSWKVWTAADSFQHDACVQAISRYAELSKDPEAEKLVVDLARGSRDILWSKHCQLAQVCILVGCLGEDQPIDMAKYLPEHTNCGEATGAKHNGYQTRWLTDAVARAYTYTGDKKWLDLAKQIWNRGSKRGYWTPSQTCADDEIKSFVSHSPPKGDGLDIRNTMRMFYEVPRAK